MVIPVATYRVSRHAPPPELEWNWTEALAMARPGTTYRVSRIPFSLAREHCEKLGCAEGEVLTCTGNGGEMLVLHRADGRKVLLDRQLAWFIQAERLTAGQQQ
jgi:hypothetical protein